LSEEGNKADFPFRDKLESWVEGILDTVEVYFRTVYHLCKFVFTNVIRNRPLSDEEFENYTFTRPGFFMILSYFIMSFLLKDIDFSIKGVSVIDYSKLLSIKNALEAARTLKIEVILINVIPAIGILILFVFISTCILKYYGENPDIRLLRNQYSYMLGCLFIGFGLIFRARDFCNQIGGNVLLTEFSPIINLFFAIPILAGIPMMVLIPIVPYKSLNNVHFSVRMINFFSIFSLYMIMANFFTGYLSLLPPWYLFFWALFGAVSLLLFVVGTEKKRRQVDPLIE
jgi:hypothetical protein